MNFAIIFFAPTKKMVYYAVICYWFDENEEYRLYKKQDMFNFMMDTCGYANTDLWNQRKILTALEKNIEQLTEEEIYDQTISSLVAYKPYKNVLIYPMHRLIDHRFSFIRYYTKIFENTNFIQLICETILVHNLYLLPYPKLYAFLRKPENTKKLSQFYVKKMTAELFEIFDEFSKTGMVHLTEEEKEAEIEAELSHKAK